MFATPPPLGVAPLTALDLGIEEYVTAAAEAGYRSVGLRTTPVSDGDPLFPLDLASPGFARLQSLLRDLDLSVLDLEVFSVNEGTTRDDWIGALDAGERLGAQYFNVVGDHPDLGEFTRHVELMAKDAASRGIVPVLEPIAYRPLNSFERSVEIARETGCLVEADMLHFIRTGASLETLRAAPELFPIVQLCDAPASLDERREQLMAVNGGDDDALALAIAESRGLRLPPGQGVAPLKQMLEILGEVHLSVEVPNVELRAGLSAVEYMTRLRVDAERVLVGLAG